VSTDDDLAAPALAEVFDRNLARYERARELSRSYFRQPWNLALWWRCTREIWKLNREMESGR